MSRTGYALILLVLIFSCKSTAKVSTLSFDPHTYTAEKKVIAEHGAVASAHPLASKAGVEIMKAGGNAFDAAVATQLSLAVVFPIAGNLGGGGFLVGRKADGTTLSIDYREKAPGAATPDMYLDAQGNANTDLSQNGHLASGVPGAVAGILETAKFGKLPLRDLMEPAIRLAEKGFILTAVEAATFNGMRHDLEKYNTMKTAFQRDRRWQAGDTLIQHDLAETLKRIRDKGLKGFYEGETARLIVEEMKRGKGIITTGDLASYAAKQRDPHVFDYKGYTIIGMPMPSSGGLLVHQMMGMIRNRNIAAMGFQTAASVQLMIEAERRAYADRALYMGDADFYKVPVKALSDTNYLDARMKDFVPGKASTSEMVQPGVLPMHESTETTHFSVIDNEGNAVAVTTTLNGAFGSKVVVGGAGFFMNNEMDDFSIKAGVANMYGAVGGDANAIAANKRMLSSMTPTIVLKDGKPFLVLGTPGGTTIPTSVFQSLVNIIEFNMSTEDALYAPKFHHQWLPDQVEIEPKFSASAKDSLKAMGYKLTVTPGIGRTEIIKVLPDGKFEAVADNRGKDAAAGW